MEEIEKIDNNLQTHTNNISESSKANMLDASIKPDVSLITPENMTPHLVQVGNCDPSLIKSYPQISVEGIEAIPVVASTLISPLSDNRAIYLNLGVIYICTKKILIMYRLF